MRFRWVALAVAVSGCELPPTGKGDSADSGLGSHTGSTTETDPPLPDHTGAVGNDDSGDHTGVPSPVAGWRHLPLVDDVSGPDLIQHEGNSTVRGIHFTAPDQGFVATTGQHWTNGVGGAVFSVDDRQVTGVVFRGAGASPCTLSGDLTDVVGLSRTDDGYVLLSGACEQVVSHDDGATWEIVGLDFGLEATLAFGSASGRSVMVKNNGTVSETRQPLGPSANWSDLWAPYFESAPLCAWGPQSQLTPLMPQTTWMSDDTERMAYVSSGYDGPVVCVSDDGGQSFLARDVPTGTYDSPHGLLFTSDDEGIAYRGNRVRNGDNWIWRTTDGGLTWVESQLPGSLSNASVEFRHAFFAPGGRVGWIVGEKDSSPMLLKTTDRGETWVESGGDLSDVVSAAGGLRLYTGFALDEDHLWLGGEYGVLVANEAGGD